MKNLKKKLMLTMALGAFLVALFGGSAGTADSSMRDFSLGMRVAAAQAVDLQSAKEIALRHAGVSEGEAHVYKLHPDYEDGRGVFEVEFTVNQCEYEYDILQSDGSIYKYSYEQKDWSALQGTRRVSMEEARDIAVGHAGFSVDEVRIYKLKPDYEDGIEVYEVSFMAGNRSFKYEVAASGAIKEYKVRFGW